MKATCIIPSRGRVNTLLAAIESLYLAQSGNHDIQYGIVCDVDDPATIGAASLLRTARPVSYLVQEREPSLGAMVNKMADLMPADVYLALSDDCLCMTKGWDEVLAQAHAKDPNGVWWWKPHDPEKVFLYAIVSEGWRKAAGQIFTDYFPYWYDDVWLLTVCILATEMPSVTLDMEILDCPVTTTRMRDLRFWHEFYLAMQPLRVKQAKDIAKALNLPQSKLVGAAAGLPDLSITEALSRRLTFTPPEFEASMEEIEATQGDKSPPSPEYIKAKQRAELILKQMAFLRGAAPTINALSQSLEAA